MEVESVYYRAIQGKNDWNKGTKQNVLKKKGTEENAQRAALEWQNTLLVQRLAIIHNKAVIK